MTEAEISIDFARDAAGALYMGASSLHDVQMWPPEGFPYNTYVC